MAERNAAAILREGTRTISVAFYNQESSNLTDQRYTFVTDMPVTTDDHVLVAVGKRDSDSLKASGMRPAVARVIAVDDLSLQPEDDVYYRWVVCVLPKEIFDGHEANVARNREIEQAVANSYRINARAAFRQALLNMTGGDGKLQALLGGPKSE